MLGCVCAGTRWRRARVLGRHLRAHFRAPRTSHRARRGGGGGARHWGGRRGPSTLWGGRPGRVEGHRLGTVAWGAPLGGAVPSRPAPPSPPPSGACSGGGGGAGAWLPAVAGVGAARGVRAAPTCLPPPKGGRKVVKIDAAAAAAEQPPGMIGTLEGVSAAWWPQKRQPASSAANNRRRRCRRRRSDGQTVPPAWPAGGRGAGGPIPTAKDTGLHGYRRHVSTLRSWG